ncbi:MAG: hypothetical protein SGI83_11220 [Bacteroidota bacterium]|nr:hypothetical protein [Bacteroidota bacterium]
MSPGMMINEQNELQETGIRSLPEQPAALKWVAKIISYIFHPVFVPVMVVWFLLYTHPYVFAGFSPVQKMRTMMMAAVSFTFFPLVTVLLLKGLKFIDTIYLHTQRDRVIPFMACMIWYFWIWYVWNNFGKTRDEMDMPREAVQFAFATFISTIIGLMVNIKIKVSLHAISAGIVLTLFILMALGQQLNFGVWLAIIFLLTGLICTARFIVSDHTAQEVYGGLAVGAIAMLIAIWVG